MKRTSLQHHLRVYVPDNLDRNMPVGRALEALILTAGGVTESTATGGWFNHDNMLSTCCGAPPGEAEGFCGKCQSAAGWEPEYVVEAVTVYEWWSPTKLNHDGLVEAMLGAGQEAVMVVTGKGECATIYEKETP